MMYQSISDINSVVSVSDIGIGSDTGVGRVKGKQKPVNVLLVVEKVELSRENDFCGGSLKLANISEKRLMFKIRTNAPKMFRAYPVLGFLESQATISVRVEVFNKSLLPTGDERFQVQVGELTPDYLLKIFPADMIRPELEKIWNDIASHWKCEKYNVGVTFKADQEGKLSNDSPVGTVSCKGGILRESDVTERQTYPDPNKTVYPKPEENISDEQTEDATTQLSIRTVGKIADAESQAVSSDPIETNVEKSNCHAPPSDEQTKMTNCCSDFPLNFGVIPTVNRTALLQNQTEFFGQINCFVGFSDQRKTIYLSLVPTGEDGFALQLFFPKVDADSRYGRCFLQILIYNRNNAPVYAFSFGFNASAGTCSGVPWTPTFVKTPTYMSRELITWAQLQGSQCFTEPNQPLNAFLNVEVTTVFMKGKANVEKETQQCWHSSFSSKLNKIATASDLYPNFQFCEKVIIKCGYRLDHTFMVFLTLLKEYSPLVGLLTREALVDGREGPLELRTPYVEPEAMTLFYEFIHGRNNGIWLDKVNENVQLLTFADIYFIPDLAKICLQNLIDTKHEFYTLESALTLILTGEKFNLKCLKELGTRWIEKQAETISKCCTTGI